MKPLIAPEQAFQMILDSMPVADIEEVPLEQAFQRILREPIVADRAIPPYDRSMMDGIAIDASADVRHFKVAGIQAAGSPAMQLTSPEDCMEIMTGAVLPKGCNCVVPIEEVTLTDGVATLAADCDPQQGQFVHHKASDQAAGSALVRENTPLGSAELAIAASCGAHQLKVSKLPKIHLITSGDEVIPPDQQPSEFQIRSSHPIAIQTAIESQNLGKVTHTHIADDQTATHEAIESALAQADILILTGGVSKGKYDFIAPTLNTLCGDSLFHGIAQRPGKPFGFYASPIPIFALPGNPLSVMACLSRYLLPALKLSLGRSSGSMQFPLAKDCPINPRLTQLLAGASNNGELTPSKPNNSGDYTAIVGCNGVIEIPPNTSLTKGTKATFFPWI